MVYQVRPFHKRNGYDLLLYVNGDLRRRKEVLWTDADFVRTGAVPAAPCVSTNATIPAVNSDWLKAVDTSDPNPANHTYGIDIQPAWDNCGGADSAGNSLATIGILDEGVDYLHQDLAANMVSAGGNFTHGDNSCCLPTSSPPGCLGRHEYERSMRNWGAHDGRALHGLSRSAGDAVQL